MWFDEEKFIMLSKLFMQDGCNDLLWLWPTATILIMYLQCVPYRLCISISYIQKPAT